MRLSGTSGAPATKPDKPRTQVVAPAAPGDGDAPTTDVDKDEPEPRKIPRATPWDIAGSIYLWGLWFFVTFLFAAQFLSIAWSTITTYQHLVYGRSPVNEPAFIPGTNDEPYTDRNVVCVAEGASYVPKQLSAVLKDPSLAQVVDTTGSLIHGYRVCKREQIEFDATIVDHYTHVCAQIAATLPVIQDTCATLGYNVTRERLHIVDDTTSKVTKVLPRALPVLLLPFWDNGIFAHYQLPGWDGMSCDLRLVGKYEQPEQPDLVIRGTPRVTREAKTAEWVRQPGGVWRNGWYEDPTGQRWYSNFISSQPNNEYGMFMRQFDGHTGVEHDCGHAHPPATCGGIPVKEWWGSRYSVVETTMWFHSVAISNGSRFGLFMYEAEQQRVVEAKYSLETFISNVTFGWILLRWLVSMYALLNSYRQELAPWHNSGLGCLACAKSFNMLPIVLIPRFKYAMAALWTVGCEFEGQQKVLSEAWFAIYPGVAEFLFFYYAILNVIAKITYRRMSDVLFGPTLIIFCLLHKYRLELAQSGWLEFDGRVSTLMLSNEVEALQPTDFFTSDAAFRLNGNVRSLFVFKLVVLALNAVPLLLSENMTSRGRTYRSCAPRDVEKALALRASNVGGLGRSRVYDHNGDEPVAKANAGKDKDGDVGGAAWEERVERPVTAVSVAPGLTSGGSDSRTDTLGKIHDRLRSATYWLGGPPPVPPMPTTSSDHVLINYEVNRLGYLVFGGRFLISFDDWYILTSMAPLRAVDKLWNHRLIAFEVTRVPGGGSYVVSHTAQLCRLDDKRLLGIPFYDITVCPFQ